MCRAAQAPPLGAPWKYGLTLLLIALAIILAATAFGLAVAGLFDRATIVVPVSGS